MNGVEYIYYFESNETILSLTSNKTFMSINPIEPQPYFSPKILTMDIETRLVKGIHVPLCICVFDGDKVFYSLFIDDWKSRMQKFF